MVYVGLVEGDVFVYGVDDGGVCVVGCVDVFYVGFDLV